MHLETQIQENSEIPLKKACQLRYSKFRIAFVIIEYADKIIEQLRMSNSATLWTFVMTRLLLFYTISDLGMAALEEQRGLSLANDQTIARRALTISATSSTILALLSQLGILRLPQC